MLRNGLTGSISKDGVKTKTVDGIIQKVYNEAIQDLLHDHVNAENQSKGLSSASSKSPKK
eukprot:9860593-Ditylum_brightwellii.AAC.1